MQFANTGPFCDIQTRYDPEFYDKYNPNSVQNRLNWNPSDTFRQYLASVKERRTREESQQVEDALMAVIDSMNASDDESGADRDQAVTGALQSASQAISQRSGGKADPTGDPSVQLILACLGDRVRLEMADDIQEEHEAQMEQRKAEQTEETLKGGEQDERDRPVYDAADAANGREYDGPAQNP